jgi:hypothetical protein
MTTRQDLIVRQGETWSFTWTKLSAGAAVNLTGYSARMSVKPRLGGAADAYLSDGSDADGGTITLGGALGTVVLAMTAAQTAALAQAVTGYVEDVCAVCGPKVVFMYDLETVSGAGVVTRELEGRFIVWRGVTQ